MMMKKMNTGLAILILATAVAGMAQGKKVTLTGHLVDQMCGAGVKNSAKAAEHTKECALMDHCANTGFGIFANGKYIKFDAEGSKRAKALAEKTTKDLDIQIVVEGTQDGDNVIVSSIKEK